MYRFEIHCESIAVSLPQTAKDCLPALQRGKFSLYSGYQIHNKIGVYKLCWCTCRLKSFLYSQDWGGWLAGFIFLQLWPWRLPGNAVQPAQLLQQKVKVQVVRKPLVSHVCHNFCQALTLQMVAGNINLGTSFQSTEFISPMTCTVSLQLQWDHSQPLYCGSKGWESFSTL